MRLEQAPRSATSRMPGRMPASRSRGGAGMRAARMRALAGRRGGVAWRSPRAGIFSAGWLGVFRLRRSWALLSAVALGILVSVVLICTVPLYSALMADIQLQRQLTTSGPLARNLEVRLDSDAISADVRASAEARLAPLARQYLAGLVAPRPTYYVVSDATILTNAGTRAYDPAATATPQIRFQAFDYAAAAPHMRFVAGAPPQAAGAGAPPQAAVTEEMAKDLGLQVGGPISVTQFGSHSVRYTAVVAGIWSPVDVDDPYWNGLSFAAANGAGADIYPVQLATGTLLAGLAPLKGVGMAQHWVYYTQPGGISIDNLDQAYGNVVGFRSHVGGDLTGISGVQKLAVLTALDQTLDGVRKQQLVLSLPLYVIVAQIVGLALLFVAAMSGLLIEGQSQEIATLKSRGASGTQILGTYTAQGAILGLIAALAGPFLAGLLALALLRWFIPGAAFAGIGVDAAYFQRLADPRGAALPALFGALLGVGTVAFSALQSARLEVLAFRREQARPSRQPFYRRYYLDVALAVLCLLGYLELGQFGGAATRVQLGTSASPLLLATPALLLLAGALLVLRFIPLGAALGARLAARGRGLTSMLAFAQVERSPNRYARMALLLVLAVGLGLFAVTFNASLARNAADRVAYDTGADVRVQTLQPEGDTLEQRTIAGLAKLPGVQVVSPAWRVHATTSQDQGNQPTDILALDPVTFGSVADGTSWRPDYADLPLSRLLGDLRAHARGPSAGAAGAPVYALVSQTFAQQLSIKEGDVFSLQLAETLGSTSFVVGHVVRDFPTLYPNQEAGFLVIGLDDFAGVIQANSATPSYLIGPNEFWLKTSQDARQHQALMQALPHAGLDVQRAIGLREASIAADANPIGTGMRGLLVIGAVMAALLAVLGGLVQSLLATRQRATQLAILRTLGTGNRQLAGLLLSEQALVYALGLLGGTLIGLLLTTATLPFLQFSDTAVDPGRIGVPPYLLVFNPAGTLYFYLVLLGAFAVALAVSARYAARIGLGQALRLGED